MASEDDLVVRIVGDTTKLQEATKRGKDELAAFKRSAKEAGKVIEDISTPQEKFARKQAELNKLLMNGHLTQDQYTRAMSKARGEMDKHSGAADKMKTSAEGAKGGISGLADSLGVAIPRLSSATIAMGALAAASKLAAFQAERLQKIKDAGREGIGGVLEARKRVFQVTGTPDEANKAFLRSDAAALGTSLSREESLELMFDAKSLGFERDFEQVAQMQQLLGKKTGTVAGALSQKFGISSEAALGGFLAGAGGSIADFEGLAQDSFSAAAGGTAIGAGASETIGTLAALTNVTGNSAQAATLMKGFGIKAGDNEALAGLGFAGAVEKLQSDPELRADFLKDSMELKQVYNAAISEKFKADRDKAQSAAQAEISSGGAKLKKQVANFVSDPSVAASIRLQNAKEAAAVIGERKGAEDMLVEAGIEQGEITNYIESQKKQQGGGVGFADINAFRGEYVENAGNNQVQVAILKQLEELNGKTPASPPTPVTQDTIP